MHAQLECDLRERRRSFLFSQPHCQMVPPAMFCDLAVSARRLDRFDDLEAGLRGLVDRQTGETYLTENEELFQFRAFN